MRNIMLAVVVVTAVTVVGCAGLQRAQDDYKVGASTPLVEGEISPHAAAVSLVEPLKPFIPAPLQPFAGIIVTALAGFGTWRRGRKLRKGQTVSGNPITGTLGAKVGIESIVQTLATIAAGIFQVGAGGSAWKRVWKTALVIIGTGTIGALSNATVAEFITSNPQIVTAFTAIASVIAGIEKKLQTVLPVKPIE